jgi:hypothetical protein
VEYRITDPPVALSTIDSSSLVQWLSALPLVERARALNIVSYMLTIHAREYGLPTSEQTGSAKKLLGINDLQHKILSQTVQYLDGEERLAPSVNSFCHVLIETAAHHGISGPLGAAISFAKSRTLVNR